MMQIYLVQHGLAKSKEEDPATSWSGSASGWSSPTSPSCLWGTSPT